MFSAKKSFSGDFPMDLTGKSAGAATPEKNPQTDLSKYSIKSENSNPNHTNPCFGTSKNPNSASSIRERKFVVAKRSSKREKEREDKKPGSNSCSGKCLSVAYENLRASQDEFFMNENEEYLFDRTLESEIEEIDDDPDEIEVSGETGSLNMKRRREKWMEEARRSVPEPGCGRVMYLVKAFEKLLTIPKMKELESKKDENGMKWALPGLQQPKQIELQVSSDSFCPSNFSVTSESLALESRVSSSSHIDNRSVLSRISGSGRKSRRNSSESTATFGGDRWKKSQPKAKPFKLRTDQRGKSKQEQLAKKLQQTMMEEEKQRIKVAQGLPRTTNEPQCLVKPPVKESTTPIDLVLHSDVRAVGRAEFDHQMAEKMSLIEQYKEEREKLEKLAEEEEIRRLRRELVPKAQPMPFFDRPFIPKRSHKLPTIPREPKFHLPQRKKIKSCMSSNEPGYAAMR